MTQEEKGLLLKDLCARLPYGVKIDVSRVEEWKELTFTPFILSNYYDEIEKIKPYLRPMSSMTEKERKYYNNLSILIADGECDVYEEMDWLNSHHFDYRIDPSTGKTLIESNLAIEAPEGMYKNL